MKSLLKPLALFLALTMLCQMLVISIVATNESCGASATYSFDTEKGTLTISGTGATYNFDKFDEEGWSPIWRPDSSGSSSTAKIVPWQKNADTIKTVVVSEGITKIGNNAFSQCYKIESIYILSENTQFSSSAFDKSGSYTVYLYRNSPANSYFSGENHTKVYLDDTSSNEGDFEFKVNSDGESVSITNYLGDAESIVIPSVINGYTVTTICKFAFGWKNATSIVIPESITSIESRAFTDCYNLKALTVKTKNADIGSDAFYSCPLDSVFLYKNSTADSYFTNSHNKIYFEEEYTVSYDANGGIGAPAPQIKTNGIDLTISEEVPTRDGYVFMGWATSKDGEGVYNAGDTYTQNADITLYAVWVEETAETYMIVYIASGSNGVPASQVKTKDVDIELSNDTPTREGFKFLGWSTVKSGEVEYLPGQLYTANESLILYAVWEEISSENIITNDYECKINPDNTTVTVIRYLGEGGNVVIPSEIEGYTVTSIGSGAFAECHALTGITIPNSIISIETDAFEGCSNLETVYLYKNSTADEYFSDADYTKVYLDEETENLCGDINSDEDIDIKDVVLFAQYLAAWSVEINELNADCNGDGSINIKDVVLLAQYLAGWEVTLG